MERIPFLVETHGFPVDNQLEKLQFLECILSSETPLQRIQAEIIGCLDVFQVAVPAGNPGLSNSITCEVLKGKYRDA